MIFTLLAPLRESLRPHFNLSKSRLETLSVLLIGMINGRTVNLSHIASQFPGPARHASNYRRLQRFFQFIRLDGDKVALLIVQMLQLYRCRYLALDRTNWKFGKRDVNILVLAIVTRRFRVPLMWSLPDHGGNSPACERIALMRRYLRLFGAHTIKMLLADREFIGTEWVEFLIENNIPFALRLKENQLLVSEDGASCSFQTLLRKLRRGTWIGWLAGMEKTPENLLRVSAKRIKGGELLIVATNTPCSRSAMNAYKKRWWIECLFADAKTRGFNIEDTHMTNPDKIATLLAIVALAATWAYRCATALLGRANIKPKAHGRPQKSYFRTGFDRLRKWLIYEPQKAYEIWHASWPKRTIKNTQRG